jgi:hypothetical protein
MSALFVLLVHSCQPTVNNALLSRTESSTATNTRQPLFVFNAMQDHSLATMLVSPQP